MNSAARVIACIGLALGVGNAQSTQSQLQPTPLEAFVRQPQSRVAWSSEAARIDSRESRAIVTALIVEDTAQPPDRMRGVRIDLSDKDGKDRVYLGEETLGAFQKAMDEISRSAAGGCASHSGGVCPPNAYIGAELFWYGNKTPKVHTLSASYYFGAEGSGLFLEAIGVRRFYFADRDASQLSAAIARAAEQLSSVTAGSLHEPGARQANQTANSR